MSDTGYGVRATQAGSSESHGTYGGTERGDGRGAEEPEGEDEGGTAEWAEKTDKGGGGTS